MEIKIKMKIKMKIEMRGKMKRRKLKGKGNEKIMKTDYAIECLVMGINTIIR